eukprot:gene6964-7513_t
MEIMVQIMVLLFQLIDLEMHMEHVVLMETHIFWINPAATQPNANNRILDKSQCNTNSGGCSVNGWSIFQQSTASDLYTLRVAKNYVGNGASNSFQIPPTWTHIAVTKNNATVSVYMNGILASVGSLTQSQVGNNGNLPLVFGAANRGQTNPSSSLDFQFKGQLDEIFLYNRVLNDDEVFLLYFIDIPTGQPTTTPSRQPTIQPSSRPTKQPTNQPSSQPSRQPVSLPTFQPTSQPSASFLSQLFDKTHYNLTQAASIYGWNMQQSGSSSNIFEFNYYYAKESFVSRNLITQADQWQHVVVVKGNNCLMTYLNAEFNFPTAQPAASPSYQPSPIPSATPSCHPSTSPSTHPVSRPSSRPTQNPFSSPTRQPTSFPSSKPSLTPTIRPSSKPSNEPSSNPSNKPSSTPSSHPTTMPSLKPIAIPTTLPSSRPSLNPSSRPSNNPVAQPSQRPQGLPSSNPTSRPSESPSIRPTSIRTTTPIPKPSKQPTSEPSSQPSRQATLELPQPTCQPSSQPTSPPTCQPSSQPTSPPTCQPS